MKEKNIERILGFQKGNIPHTPDTPPNTPPYPSTFKHIKDRVYINGIQEIITASFKDSKELQDKGYLCLSIIGKVYGDFEGKEKIGRVKGLNIFRHYHHLQANDFKSCYILFQKDLIRLGLEKILQRIIKEAERFRTDKIALCGYGTENDFCYRHIIGTYLRIHNIEIKDYSPINYLLQKQYWLQNIYLERGHHNLTDSEVLESLERCIWIFAKTMPSNPHYYTVRKTLGDDRLFLGIVKHIRCFGEIEIFENIVYRVLYFNEYKYWTMPSDNLDEDCDLINRALS